MTKKPFLWLLFLMVVFVISLQITSFVHPKLLWFSDIVKNTFLNSKEAIISFTETHFNQVQTIEKLTQELKQQETLELELQNLQSQFDNLAHSFSNLLLLETNTTKENPLTQLASVQPRFYPVRSNSYVTLGDSKKLWLTVPKIFTQDENQEYQKGKIFGLVYNNNVAGIAVYKEGRLMGHLNGDELCSYSVTIGDSRATGIVKYDIGGTFIVDYIPSWFNVQKGDMITTSGLDGIFFSGLQVGSVTDIEYRQGYKVARFIPFSQSPELYYWLIDIPKTTMLEDITDTVEVE